MHIFVVGDVVTVVAQGRWEKRQQPETGDAQFLEIIQFLDQALKVANAIAITVEERLDVCLINNRILIPERISHEFENKPRIERIKRISIRSIRSIRGLYLPPGKNPCQGTFLHTSSDHNLQLTKDLIETCKRNSDCTVCHTR